MLHSRARLRPIDTADQPKSEIHLRRQCAGAHVPKWHQSAPTSTTI